MEAVDQRLTVVDTDVEEAVEAGLQLRKSRPQYTETIVQGLTKGNNGDGEQSENSAYLDENGGALEDLNIHKIMSPIEHHRISNGKAETAIASREETRGRSELIEVQEEEVVEEEVVELEFEKVAPKLHTHTMHCPNCDAHITKVVLRRKIIRPKRTRRIIEEPREPVDLLGCFSCFSLFTSAGNGRFNPFPIWSKPEPASSSTGAQPAGNEVEVSGEEGNCFSIFRVLWKPIINVNDPQQGEPGENDGSSVGVTISEPKDSPSIGDHVPSHLGGKSKTPVKHETSIDIPVATSPALIQGQTQRQDSKSFEILKSIVYGGLMEVIASLSIVASAAAADATTLSIVALALANLIGGILMIGHNLWDLRNDCYRISNEQTLSKYKELLGEIGNFPLHMFFAILSFFMFGVIPPVAYGYAFHETNDKDFTLLVVAGVSMVCVGLLAIIKGYVDRCVGFWGYVKIIMYYLSTMVVVSGVSYVIGDLVTRLIEKLGLFEMTPGVDMSVLPHVVSTNTGLAYY